MKFFQTARVGQKCQAWNWSRCVVQPWLKQPRADHRLVCPAVHWRAHETFKDKDTELQ